MRLESLWIENFRSIRSMRLEGLGAFNVFYGENGAGKSNVLAAIERLYGELAGWAQVGGAGQSGVTEQDFPLPQSYGRPISLGARWRAPTKGRRARGQFPNEFVFEVRRDFFGRTVLTRAECNGRDVSATEWRVEPDKIEEMAMRWQIQALAVSHRLLPAVRALGVETDANATPELSGAERIAWLLGAGRIKQALVEAVTSPDIAVRSGMKRMQAVFSGPPLHRPEFDPIFDPARHTYALNEIHYTSDGDPYPLPVDLSGLGIQQIYHVMAGIFLGAASVVGLEEPEAHLHPRTSGLQLRALLEQAVAGGHVDQLFIATHSNLFDLDPTGYFFVSKHPERGTLVERRTEFAQLDREVFWEPGPARHALQDMLRYLPAETVVFRRADGTAIAASEMLALLQADAPDAIAFVDDVQATAVRSVQRLATRGKRPE